MLCPTLITYQPVIRIYKSRSSDMYDERPETGKGEYVTDDQCSSRLQLTWAVTAMFHLCFTFSEVSRAVSQRSGWPSLVGFDRKIERNHTHPHTRGRHCNLTYSLVTVYPHFVLKCPLQKRCYIPTQSSFCGFESFQNVKFSRKSLK